MFLVILCAGVLAVLGSTAYPHYRYRRYRRKMKLAKEIGAELVYQSCQQKMAREIKRWFRIEFPLLVVGLGLIVVGLCGL